MSQRVIVRLSLPGSATFPRLRDGRKAHGRDGRTAERPDGPARASSPRPVIRGESPPVAIIEFEGGPERRLYGP